MTGGYTQGSALGVCWHVSFYKPCVIITHAVWGLYRCTRVGMRQECVYTCVCLHVPGESGAVRGQQDMSLLPQPPSPPSLPSLLTSPIGPCPVSSSPHLQHALLPPLFSRFPPNRAPSGPQDFLILPPFTVLALRVTGQTRGYRQPHGSLYVRRHVLCPLWATAHLLGPLLRLRPRGWPRGSEALRWSSGREGEPKDQGQQGACLEGSEVRATDLNVVVWIPVRVVDDDGVCRGQVDAQATSPGGKEKAELLGPRG